MPQKPLRISERIEPTLIPALFKNFDNAEIAILELIDNAIDDGIEDKMLEISIEIDSVSLTITNKGGYGMGFEELDSFFAWGKTNKKASLKRLGRYGQGGKAAMGYLAKSCQIITTKIGEDKEYLVDVEDWGDRQNGYVNAEVKERDSDEVEQGLVKFRLWGLKKKIIPGNLVKTLNETYAPLLREGKVKMWLNHTQITGFELLYEEGPKRITFEIGAGKTVRAEIGLIRYRKGIRGGFRCYEFGRLIISGEYFGQKTREDKYAFEKLAGEIFIDFDVPLIMNKTNFDKDSEDWRSIEAIMFDRLEPWIKELSGTRKEVSKVELNHQKNINRAFQSFRLEQRLSVRNNQDEEGYEEEDTEDKYKNLIPNYSIEFRALDKSLRYQVVTEDGEKKILVNLAYPAYKVWQKDMDLYIVDIIVQELARQQSFTVEEFVKNANKIFGELSNSIKD